ncbi:uncharacterized protein TNCV_4887331 [Trichonephila clavipes]|nr:uncharacterized protein TNCV_4887331 [Trichonephila clavipes]
MYDIKIDGTYLFVVERRLNAYLNSNKLEQLENQHAEKLVVVVVVSFSKGRKESCQSMRHVGLLAVRLLLALALSTIKWLVTLTVVPHDLGSNCGEGTVACKYIVPSQYRGTLNSRRAARHLVKLVEGEEKWEASDHPQGVLSQNWSGTESIRTVTCMVLKAKTNDKGKNLVLSHDNFRGLRSNVTVDKVCHKPQQQLPPTQISVNSPWRSLIHFHYHEVFSGLPNE